MRSRRDVQGKKTYTSVKEDWYVFTFLRLSEIHFLKLYFHCILLMFLLSLFLKLSEDLTGWLIGTPIETNTRFVPLIVMLWIFFGLQSERYKKKARK